MSLYTISANGKESWKMIQRPRNNPDPLQKLNRLSPAHMHSSSKNIIKIC